MDYSAALAVLGDPDFGERQPAVIGEAVRRHRDGFILAEVTALEPLLRETLVRAEEAGGAFLQHALALVAALGKPYKRARAAEELGHAEALSAILSYTIEAVFSVHAELASQAAASLLVFTRAIGYDAGAPATPAPGGAPNPSAWVFHQALLRAGGCLPHLVSALRHYLMLYFDAGGTQRGVREDLARSLTMGGKAAAVAAATGGALTHAVSRAAIVASPDILVLLGRTLREVSEASEAAAALVQAGLPQLCVTMLGGIDNLRDPCIPLAVEILWNLLETTNGACATVDAGVPSMVANGLSSSLEALLTRHRGASTARALGTTVDVLTLGGVLERCLEGADSGGAAEKELRNDVVVLLKLLAAKPEVRPIFAASGLLKTLIRYATAAETGARVGAGRAAFASTEAVDLEFKKLLWATLDTLCEGDFAGLAVPAGEDTNVDAVAAAFAASRGKQSSSSSAVPEGSVSCLSIVSTSPLVPALLLHLEEDLSGAGEGLPPLPGADDPEYGLSSPGGSKLYAQPPHVAYLRSLPLPARRGLQLSSLSLLATLLPRLGPEAAAGWGVHASLLSFIRSHLPGAEGAGGAGEGGELEAVPSPAAVSSPSRASYASSEAGRGGRGAASSLRSPPGQVVGGEGGGGGAAAGRSSGPDPGRALTAARVLQCSLAAAGGGGTAAAATSLRSAALADPLSRLVCTAGRRADPFAARRALAAPEELAPGITAAGWDAATAPELRDAEAPRRAAFAVPDGASPSAADASAALAVYEVAAALGEAGLVGDLLGWLAPLVTALGGGGTGAGAAALASTTLSPQRPRGPTFTANTNALAETTSTAMAGTASGFAGEAGGGPPNLRVTAPELIEPATTRFDVPSGAEALLGLLAVLCAPPLPPSVLAEAASAAAAGAAPSLPSAALAAAAARVGGNRAVFKRGGGGELLGRLLRTIAPRFAADPGAAPLGLAALAALRGALLPRPPVAATPPGADDQGLVDFVGAGGLDALLDTVKAGAGGAAAAATLLPAVLATIADICLYAPALSAPVVWGWVAPAAKGSPTGFVELLVTLWHDEEKRLGVARLRTASGSILNDVSRPLASPGAVAPAVPGSLAPGATAGSPDAASPSASGGASAFRTLRQALAAARMWDPRAAAPAAAGSAPLHAQGVAAAATMTLPAAPPAQGVVGTGAPAAHAAGRGLAGAALAAWVAGSDLRHKLWATLVGVGATALPTADDAALATGPAWDAWLSSVFEALDGALVAASTGKRGGAPVALSATATAPLPLPGAVSGPVASALLLARSYPALLSGTAWAEAAARLDAAQLAPLEPDATALAAEVEKLAALAVALQTQQGEAVEACVRQRDPEEAGVMAALQARHEQALDVATTMSTMRASKVSVLGQRTLPARLTVAERAAAKAHKAAMLSTSLAGFRRPGSPTIIPLGDGLGPGITLVAEPDEEEDGVGVEDASGLDAGGVSEVEALPA